jgi:hypothetical protein
MRLDELMLTDQFSATAASAMKRRTSCHAAWLVTPRDNAKSPAARSPNAVVST